VCCQFSHCISNLVYLELEFQIAFNVFLPSVSIPLVSHETRWSPKWHRTVGNLSKIPTSDKPSILFSKAIPCLLFFYFWIWWVRCLRAIRSWDWGDQTSMVAMKAGTHSFRSLIVLVLEGSFWMWWGTLRTNWIKLKTEGWKQYMRTWMDHFKFLPKNSVVHSILFL
jgi:hypothetical protein